MLKKKIKNQEQVLTNPIVIRITLEDFDKLEKIRKESNCRSIGEVVREVLSKQRITYLHRDISMNDPMEVGCIDKKKDQSYRYKYQSTDKSFSHQSE